MASSRVMASSSSANSDLTRQSSLYSLSDAAKTLGSMSMDDLLRNIYSPSPAPAPTPTHAVAHPDPPLSPQRSFNLPSDEAWREISAPKVDADAAAEASEMTLEDFLAKAGAVREEDVRGVFGATDEMFGNGGGGRGGRGRKRPMMDPADRAALQRQKRMIKNRESAARSRERKQAYTLELETIVTQLEEQNAQLVSEQEEMKRMRLKQLLENVIPVTEERKPTRPLRKVKSMIW